MPIINRNKLKTLVSKWQFYSHLRTNADWKSEKVKSPLKQCQCLHLKRQVGFIIGGWVLPLLKEEKGTEQVPGEQSSWSLLWLVSILSGFMSLYFTVNLSSLNTIHTKLCLRVLVSYTMLYKLFVIQSVLAESSVWLSTGFLLE